MAGSMRAAVAAAGPPGGPYPDVTEGDAEGGFPVVGLCIVICHIIWKYVLEIL